MTVHYLLRIGDGKHFVRSSIHHIWGVDSKTNDGKWFLSNVKEGDQLWFVQSNSNGKLIATATYSHQKPRELGPLISLTQTNEELGWTETHGDWDVEIHYKNLYNLTECGLYSAIKSPRVFRRYNEKCKVNLPAEYPYIVRYSNVSLTM
jgi:hypothetical protein